MDRVSINSRSQNMRAIKSQGMKPELVVRKLVHGLGYRYRLHRKDLPGTPDIVFGPRKAAIFVHGCFWHQHSNCKRSHRPKSNTDYWKPKLKRNAERDKKALRELAQMGWKTIVIWECETDDLLAIANRVSLFLED